MCSLHHPSPCSPPRTLFHTLHFFSPRSEVGDEAKSLKQYTHFIEVVSFIHTPTLSFLFCRPRSFDGNARDRLFRPLEIISIRSINGKADEDTSSFSEHTPFCPSKRRLRHHSIPGTETPVNAFEFVVPFQALLPELFEYSSAIPFLRPTVS